MTAPPTPATLDAAVYVLAAELWHDSNPGMPIVADCRAWQECVGMARRAVAAAMPILAAADADQLAQAHAAGTAEGAAAERERCVAFVLAEAEGWPLGHSTRRHLKAVARKLDPVTPEQAARALEAHHRAAIARAGTSEVPS